MHVLKVNNCPKMTQRILIIYLYSILASSPAQGLRLNVPRMRSRSPSPSGLEKTPIPWLNKCKLVHLYVHSYQ